MESSISDIQSAEAEGDPYFNLSDTAAETSLNKIFVTANDDVQPELSENKFSQGLCLKNDEEMDSFDARYNAHQNAADSMPSASFTNSISEEMEFQDDFSGRNEEVKIHGMMDFQIKTDEESEIQLKQSSVLVTPQSQEYNDYELSYHGTSSSFHFGEHSAKVSEVVVGSTVDESIVKAEIFSEVKLEPDSMEDKIEPETCMDYTADTFSFEKKADMSKLDLSSEDEELHFEKSSAKSGAESSSSKDESPSGPSCSGTSRTGINSPSSDSENDARNINLSLPIKKRKRECLGLVETIISSSSSCSEDESKSEIDYTNLTPDEIKALIEEAKRYGRIKQKCRCPKKKWSELPVKGPTETSKNCTIGKGDWSEKPPQSCAACALGRCVDDHKRGRHSRRKCPPSRLSVLAKSRARGTIGLDVPIIELSDSEETPMPSGVASEVTIPAVSAGECIVLSSSEDDDDIVCERVVKVEPKNQPSTTSVPLVGGSPDVVVLNSACSQTNVPPVPLATQAFPHPVPSVPQVPQAPDSELWPDFNIELDDWETMNLLANIVGPPSSGGVVTSGLQANASAVVPDRPSSPEGWSCPICLESKTLVPEIMSTTCGHVFCGSCIRSSVKIHKKCPTCRKKLTMKQFHKIFL